MKERSEGNTLGLGFFCAQFTGDASKFCTDVIDTSKGWKGRQVTLTGRCLQPLLKAELDMLQGCSQAPE